MKTYQSTLECGQAAWLIRENKVVSMPVGAVEIKAVAGEDGDPSHETITYLFRICKAGGDFVGWEEHNQSRCFASKEQLLASL